MNLEMATGLSLPLDAVTETFAILAKRGKGKTYTAAVMCEEMIGAGMPVVVFDPVGVWWGLRSSASGTEAGLPVVIFGGDHADVPLEESAGALTARLIVERRFPAVIDLSGLSKAASRRFMAAFVETLYQLNREPLHVFVDEADSFAPQRTTGEGARLLGAMEDLVRRGRARGIGVTLITQRPAVLNKDVLTQAEVLIALGMTGVRDVAAIDEWVRLHADEDAAREVKRSLPGLGVGEAWIWSPSWLDILQKVQIRKRRTFDSSATPKAGQKRRKPLAMSEVDITALGEQIAATVEKAKAEDPAALRRKVTSLEKRLLELQTELTEARERPSTPDLAEWSEGAGDLEQVLKEWREQISPLLAQLEGGLSGLKAVAGSRQVGRSGRPVPQAALPAPVEKKSMRGSRPQQVIVDEIQQVPDGDVKLGKTEKVIMAALFQHGAMEQGKLALLTGYSAKASTIGVAASKLRKAGLLAAGAPYALTPAGTEYCLAGFVVVEPLPEGDALIDYWRQKFGLTERKVLDVLLDVWPTESSQIEVAEATGYSPTASTIGVALSKLRKAGVVAGWHLSDDFAEAVGLS